MFETEMAISTQNCRECKGSYGIHAVTCSAFRCSTCGKHGPDEDHNGGCPTLRMDEVRWTCQCGKSGWMNPTNRSLAGLVRQARREHKCAGPDIEKLETRPEYDRRIYYERFHAGVI